MHGGDEPEVMLDINTTPLIDVLLVLLVMLIITIPIQLHAINLEMPKGVTTPQPDKPEKIRIDIDANSILHWQGIAVSAQELENRMGALGSQTPQPELHIRPDKSAQYAVFAHVLSTSKRQGLRNIAVIGSEQFAP